MELANSTADVKAVLHAAIEAVLPAWHVAVDGDIAPAAAYTLRETHSMYESGAVLYSDEVWQLHVFQHNFDPRQIDNLIASLKTAGFGVRRGAQSMDNNDYVTEITATMRHIGG